MAMVTPMVQVVGVCTDSHVTVRTMLMKSASLKVTIPYSMMMASDMTILSLKGIKFPIICDRDGDFSRAFGVLKLSDGNFGAARAVLFLLKLSLQLVSVAQVAVLDPEKRLVHLRLHNERTRARFLIIFAATKNHSIVFTGISQ